MSGLRAFPKALPPLFHNPLFFFFLGALVSQDLKFQAGLWHLLFISHLGSLWLCSWKGCG